MTLAAGFKFEHPRAGRVSPVFLVSDSRYSTKDGGVARDDGQKIWDLAKNVFAAVARDLQVAQRALATVKKKLAQSPSGSFDALKSILTYSFDKTMLNSALNSHCIVAVMASDGACEWSKPATAESPPDARAHTRDLPPGGEYL